MAFLKSVLSRIMPGSSRLTLRQAAFRDRWAEIDGEDYVNSKHGVRLRGLNEWICVTLDPEFEVSGGFLSVVSPDGTASLSFSSGSERSLDGALKPRSEVKSDWVRHATVSFEPYRTKLGGNRIVRVPLSSLDGEDEVVHLEFSTQQTRIGKVCALHHGDEYVLFYSIRNGSSARIETILAGWKWFMRLRAQLTGSR